VTRPAGLAVAFCALALPAAAQPSPDLLAAAQALPAATQLEPVLRGAPCVFADGVRHLDPLPSGQPWTRPQAIVVVQGLPGQPEGSRAALMRVTREMAARVQLRALIAAGNTLLLDFQLAPLPAEAPTPAFLAILSPAGTTLPETCALRPGR